MKPNDSSRSPDPTSMITIAGATVDSGRQIRCGFGEVIYGEGKPSELIARIAGELLAVQREVLVTRVNAAAAAEITAAFPHSRYCSEGRTLRLSHTAITDPQVDPDSAPIAVVTAGSTDRGVAAEARETLHWMGFAVDWIEDIGVAGPQRLLAMVPRLQRCRVIVVVAGMEGALPSVVAGHVSCPVIGVPTSVGYGAALGGLTAMLGMMTSCAAGVAVVNIDAGFRGGYLAGMIAKSSQVEQGIATPAPSPALSDLRPPYTIPKRARDAHKGDQGKLLLIGGSRGMAGAIALSGMSALKSGAGLVTVATPASCLATVASFHPCLMTLSGEDADGQFAVGALAEHIEHFGSYDAVAIGPGMGTGAGAGALLDAVLKLTTPRVIDADGLNLLARQDRLNSLRGPCVLTPHPGEWGRITGASSRDREAQCATARDFALRHQCIVLLKGANTFVTDGTREYVNQTGNPGMATAGSGDCLTGLLVSLLGQGLEPWSAACLGAWAHGRAGDLAARQWGEIGMTARELVDQLGPALEGAVAE